MPNVFSSRGKCGQRRSFDLGDIQTKRSLKRKSLFLLQGPEIAFEVSPVAVMETRSLTCNCRADPSESVECSARSIKNIGVRGKDACLDHYAWDLDIRISDAEDRAARCKGARSAFVTGAILGTLGIGCVLGAVAYFFDRTVSTPANRNDTWLNCLIRKSRRPLAVLNS